jgi:xylan 1,4-beta-xylosidase
MHHSLCVMERPVTCLALERRKPRETRVFSQSRISARARWRLLVGLFVLTSPARAETPPTVNVSVDATAAGTLLERVWAFHGYDEINYTTVPEGKALLGTLAAAHTAPLHVRNHFLLNDGDGVPALKWGSTDVYSEDGAGNPVYSWRLMDGILDTITEVGAFPFIEFGFMPQALSTHPSPYLNSSTTALDSGCFYPPNDYGKWGALIRASAQHANQRYPTVGETWLWELWNEPDIGYWQGTFADYVKLYDYTEAALHETIPNALLGGPAVAGPRGSFLSDFLQHCATGTNAVTGNAGTRLDLISFHAKGGVSIAENHVQMDLGNQLRLHSFGFNAVAAFPQFAQTPIYITEADPDDCAACSASSTPADAYRNSTAYGAYEIAMMKHTIELEAEVGVKLGGVLTWAFTFPGSPYFDGYRALATNGLNLPVLAAFKLLGRLDGDRLPLTSSGALALSDILANGIRGQPEVDGMATLDASAIQVLMWNYHDDIVPVAAARVHLTIQVPASFGVNARVSHLRVDESHGDAYTVWVSQGMPASPSAAQIKALQQAMEPSLLAPDATVAVAADGSVCADFDLPRFGVSLLTIEPAVGVSAAEVTEGCAVSARGSDEKDGAKSSDCACRIGVRRDDAANSVALHCLGALLVILVRRRSARVTSGCASDGLDDRSTGRAGARHRA